MPRPPSPFVVVGRMGSVLEANLAAAKLRGAGVNALVEPTNAFAATGLVISLNNKGVGILVPESQADRATKILEEFERESLGEGRTEGAEEMEGEPEALEEEGGEDDEPAGTEEKGVDLPLSWWWFLLIMLAAAAIVLFFAFLMRSGHGMPRGPVPVNRIPF